MSSHPLTSIVIPTYNRAEFILEALESVFLQDFHDYEIIVVDDGSTDDTENVITPFLEQLRYIKTPNRGVSNARNTGIREAKGQYVAFLDSDDIWPKDSLRRRMEALLNDPDLDFVYADVTEFNEDGMLTESFQRDYFDPTNMFNSLLMANRIPTPTVICRRSVLLDAGLFDTEFDIAEDWKLWLIIAQNHKICFLDYIAANMRKHGKNVTIDIGNNFYFATKLLKEVLASFSLTEKQRKTVRDRLADIYEGYGYKLYQADNFQNARQCFRQSAKYATRSKGRLVLRYLATFLPARILHSLRHLRKTN